MAGGSADHDHLLHALEGDDGGADANDAVGSVGTGVGLDALDGEMSGVIEDVAELFDLAPSQTAEGADDAAAQTNGIGDVAEGEVLGREAAVKLAVQLLAVGGGGEFELLRVVALAVNRRAHA